jgi:hypothetical protein
MEYVMRLLGAIAIVAGLFVAAQVIVALQRSGVPLDTVQVIRAIGSGLGGVVAGFVLLGFGTVIALLRQIKHNTDH